MAKRTSKTGTWARSSSGSGAGPDVHFDYGYVRADLRRIGILAGTFLALLVVLSFLLN